MNRIFAEKAIEAAGKAGLTDLLFHEEVISRQSVAVFEGRPETTVLSRENPFLLEGSLNGKRGAVFSERQNPGEIPALVRALCDTANAFGEPRLPIILPEMQDRDGAEDVFDSVDTDGMTDRLLEAEAGALTAATTARLSLSILRKSVILTDDRGRTVSQSFANALFQAQMIKKAVESVGTASVSVLSRTLPDCLMAAEECAKRAAEMAGAVPCKSGSYPAVLSGEVVAGMLSIMLPAFHADRAQRGMSRLKDMEGKTVAHPSLIFKEDPDGLLTRAIDDEGAVLSPKTLIEDGILQTLLYNRRSAAEAGRSSTGNGFRRVFNAGVTTGGTNFTLDARQNKSDLAGLLSAMGDGLYVAECDGMFAGVNAGSGDFSVISKGFLVRAGRLEEAVSRFTVGGNFFDLLKRVAMTGTDPAACEDRELNSVSAYPVLVESLTVSGV